MSSSRKTTRPHPSAEPRKKAAGGASQPTVELVDPLVGRVFGERYRILRRLGQGGMGAVYEAHHIGLERSCAVKVLPDLMAGDPDAVQRFFREARATAQLNHPSVVGIHDVGWEGRQPYIAMELINGRGLDTVLVLEKPLEVAYVLDVAIQAASGLAAAHDKGIIHRDVKPANLMVTEAGVLKVLDFGLARLLEGGGQISRSGMVVGTLQFMSPEQASAEAVDERTDVYSLGATIYTLIAGAPPFDAPTAAALLIRTVQDEAPELAQLRPGVRPEVVAVVRRMMAKSPDRRYASMAECHADLERVARGQAPRAGMSRAEALADKVRGRWRGAAAAVLFVAIALAVARWSADPGGAAPVDARGSGSTLAPAVDAAEDQGYLTLEATLASEASSGDKLAAIDAFLEHFPAANVERIRFAFGWKLKLAGAGSDPAADPTTPAAREAERAYVELGPKLELAARANRYADAIAIADEFLAVHGNSNYAKAMRARRDELVRHGKPRNPTPAAALATQELEEALAGGEVGAAVAAFERLLALDPEAAKPQREKLAARLKADMLQAIRNGQRDAVERLVGPLETFDPEAHRDALAWLAQRDTLPRLERELEEAIRARDFDECVRLQDAFRAAGAPADALGKLAPRIDALRAGAPLFRTQKALARAAEARDLPALEAALAALEAINPGLARAQAMLYGSLLLELRSASAGADATRLRPALEALHTAMVQAIKADWADPAKTFARAHKAIEAATDPGLAGEVAEYRRHIELLTAMRADASVAVAAAGLEGRDSSEVFGDRYLDGKIAAVRDGAIVLAVRGAQVSVPVSKLAPLELYRIGRLVSWRAPLTGLAMCTVLAYHGHRFEARALAVRAKLSDAELGVAVSRLIGAEFPSGSLERSWQRRAVLIALKDGRIEQLVPSSLKEMLYEHAGSFEYGPMGVTGEGVLFPRVDGAHEITATWQVPALRLPKDDSHLSILVRFERLDKEKDLVELRWIEIALRLDQLSLEVMRRDPESGTQSREVGAEAVQGPLACNGGEVTLGIRLDPRAEALLITGTVAGVALSVRPYPFNDRRLSGFALASIGHATHLKLVELRRLP